ncbi:MAG: hypothetical protein WCO56_21650 [Verrucomicrobiota bacterium]
MQSATLLLRQVHPQWLKEGHVLSLAFRPFPKDAGLLSVYDGDLITAEASHTHFTRDLGFQSAGVWAVSGQECQSCDLPARSDAEGHYPEHAVIDFTAHPEKAQKAKSKILAARAEERGCLFRPA